MLGGLRRFWVSCNPLCSPVKHDYGHCVDGDVRVLFFVIARDRMISRDLVTELAWSFPGIASASIAAAFFLFCVRCTLAFAQSSQLGSFGGCVMRCYFVLVSSPGPIAIASSFFFPTVSTAGRSVDDTAPAGDVLSSTMAGNASKVVGRAGKPSLAKFVG